MTILKLNRRKFSPTHRSEVQSLGKIYLNSACDFYRINNETVELLTALNLELYRAFQRLVPLYPCENEGADCLDDINLAVFNHTPLPVFAGGTRGVLGLNPYIEQAAHDYVHYQSQAEFNLVGEFQAFLMQARFCEDYGLRELYDSRVIQQAISVLYSDIYLQACAYDYLGDYPEFQKIVLTATPYR